MKNVFLYLFVFSLLINVFLYVNDSKILKSQETELAQTKTKTTQLKDSLKLYKNMYDEASYFSIDENENAQKTFKEYKYDEAMQKVLHDLTILNTQEGGNPLLPVASDGSKTIVHKASVLNHKWIILDYYNDTYTGEMLVEYTFDPNKFTEFKTISNTVY
ncbi:hypothetical protein QW060_20485 [Myroides ceti]|uniref:Hydrolase n=1 Tax=Paenimyroides ceti TaxID=395087 RepID=A0ABT8D1Q1_9FLAO|nr:hypothetical protein [Paenimyroides ceti]MDN3706729.1 hypothetical protein [Paenimyroides ceti]MDN3709390.1 hypothetical protein [Paenimyroides ceti]